ncbi:MAG: BamA/TamA family outer membrane protein [Bacteroidales bacterium]|nr:BamA/TamA family outer membrane protein [Bacteroidales bacterium]
MRYFLPLLFIVLIISSCNPTKYVPEGETLLNDNHIIINKEGVKKSDLLPYIKQKPNKRIFGTRFHLGLYNLSNINKQKWPHKWLRDIGEEPAVFDPNATVKTKDQIKSYVASKGYFDGQVMDTVETANRKSEVFYNVDLLPAYTIRNLYYEISDSNIQKLCYFDSMSCVIERGKPYDVDVLQAERLRFERFIKDYGFYGFSTDHIYFRVDSTVGNRQVDIYYGVKNFTKLDAFDRVSLVPHSIYRVKNIYIYPDFVPRDALEGGEAYLNSLDTTNYNGYYFITRKGKPEIKYDLIIQSLYLKPGSVFNVTNTEQTQAHLLALKVYRLVNIIYNDLNEPGIAQGSEMMLDCNIQLTLLSQQSYKVELEGTNTSGNLGGALNLIYQHKNLFHGAELFSIKLKGAYEANKQDSSKLQSTQEYGFETSLRLPKFLLPFIKTESFIKKYNPTTTLLAAYNYQAMPAFTRTIATATFGYNWKAGNYQEHIVNPLQLNIVKLPPGSIDSAFAARIESSSQANSYKDVMILGGNYSYIYNNQKIKKSRDYWFLRINAEASGNMLEMAGKLTGAKKTDGSYKILGLPFAQYVRTDFDLRYNYILNDVSSIVYRGFFGIGIPYGNSKAIPFEKQYFGGGANGIRAWQVRSLGPGSYDPGNPKFLNQTADIKLEANAEYRFKLFWILEGALFLDAGNIWAYNNDPSRPGSQFIFNKFYKDIAVGTGAGLRFDFKFVIGRVDIGMKLRDPLLPDGSKWIIMSRSYERNDFTMVLGIGYPF